MPVQEKATNWELIDQAANGNERSRQAFAIEYYPVVESYLQARWRQNQLKCLVEDACQEVFAECFRDKNPLQKVDRNRPGGFHAFFYGIVRIVALRIEYRERRILAKTDITPDSVAGRERSVHQSLDRDWAIEVVKAAEQKQQEHANSRGAAALVRVELLRLRFRSNMPIRQIARLWNRDATRLHREYGKAKKEFLMALREVVSSREQRLVGKEVDRHCRELIGLIS